MSPDRVSRRPTIDPNTLLEFLSSEKFKAPNVGNKIQKNYLADDFSKDMRIDS